MGGHRCITHINLCGKIFSTSANKLPLHAFFLKFYNNDFFQLQLAPTLKQQASAMLTILDRYTWRTFSIVTGKIAGHHNFEIVRNDHLTLGQFLVKSLFPVAAGP